MHDKSASPRISDRDIGEILVEVVADVLEQFAFMFIAPIEPKQVTLPAHSMWRAEIRFTGPFSGRLSLCGSAPFCALLASNILGMDTEELTPEHTRDALKELVNVTCGELLVALSGKKTVFNLTVPTMERIDTEAARAALTRPDTIPVMVDDEPLIISAGLNLS